MTFATYQTFKDHAGTPPETKMRLLMDACGLGKLSVPQRRTLMIIAGGWAVIWLSGDPIVWGRYAGARIRRSSVLLLEKFGLVVREPFGLKTIVLPTVVGATAAAILHAAGELVP